MQWLMLSSLGLLTVVFISAKLSGNNNTRVVWKLAFWTAFGCALLLPVSFIFDDYVDSTLKSYAALLAWLAAIMILPINSDIIKPESKRVMCVGGLAAGLCIGGLLVAQTWADNLVGFFHIGLLIIFLLLILCKLWFRLPTWGVQSVNTFLILVVMLPATDVFMRLIEPSKLRPEDLKNYYSFEAAKKNPRAFGRWWRYYGEQWQQFSRDVMRGGPRGPRLLPSGRSKLVESSVEINSRGFRGKEISPNKGNAYRIVALGESTTFGITLKPTDLPWPAVLEEMIRTRLQLDRTVEVINAGVPAIQLTENLQRMAPEILPLQPDIIISYHGLNGFLLLSNALPSMRAEPAPEYKPRPLKLLAEAEYGLKLRLYKRRYEQLNPHQLISEIANPMATEYATAYKELIMIAATNHIRLVLANYSMAVNRQSDPEVVNFYKTGSPALAAQMVANVAHNQIVAELARLNPDICFVDAQAHLDGNHAMFIDMVHFTQDGRQRMAELMFEAIKPILEADCNYTNRATGESH